MFGHLEKFGHGYVLHDCEDPDHVKVGDKVYLQFDYGAVNKHWFEVVAITNDRPAFHTLDGSPKFGRFVWQKRCYQALSDNPDLSMVMLCE